MDLNTGGKTPLSPSFRIKRGGKTPLPPKIQAKRGDLEIISLGPTMSNIKRTIQAKLASPSIVFFL